MKTNKLLGFLLALPLLVVALNPGTAHASLASLTAGATYITADGQIFGMDDTSISVKSNKDNTYGGALSSGGCYGCRTGSQWKDGVRQEYYPNDAVAVKNTDVVNQQWGVSFDYASPKYTWGCGNSDCTSGTDNGDCNNFRITMTKPSGSMFNNGYWVGREWGYTDPGLTGGLTMETRSDSIYYDIPLNNGGRTYLRLDYRLNRAPTAYRVSAAYGTDTDGNFQIPTGLTQIPIALTGKFNDLDPEQGSIQIMYKKSNWTNWMSFGNTSGALNPDNNNGTSANNITTGLNPYGWVTPNFNKNTNRAFPAVNLDAGTYSWAVRAIDQYGNYSSTWSSIGTFIINAPSTSNNVCLCSIAPTAINCVQPATGLTHDQTVCQLPTTTPDFACAVTPETGLAPLVISVTANPVNITAPAYDYDMNNDGTYEYTNRTSPVFYTYDKAGSYVVRVHERTTNLIRTCSPNPVGVTDPNDTGGGEVTP